jgi:hypothetical protein
MEKYPSRSVNQISQNTFNILQGVKQQLQASQNSILTDDTPSIPGSIRLAEALSLGTFASVGMNMYKGALKDEDYGRIWVRKTFEDPKTGAKEDWLVAYEDDEGNIIRQLATEQLQSMKKAASLEKKSGRDYFVKGNLPFTKLKAMLKQNGFSIERGEKNHPYITGPDGGALFFEINKGNVVYFYAYGLTGNNYVYILEALDDAFPSVDIIDEEDMEWDDEDLESEASSQKYSNEDLSGIQTYYQRRKVMREKQGDCNEEEAKNLAIEDTAKYFQTDVDEIKEIVKTAASQFIGRTFQIGDAKLKVIEPASGYVEGHENDYWIKVVEGKYGDYEKGEEFNMKKGTVEKYLTKTAANLILKIFLLLQELNQKI